MIQNWTLFTLLFPRLYVEDVDIDLREWSSGFEWEQDEWNGFKDFLTPPTKTVENNDGDCEDYAFVVLSHHYYKEKDVSLAVCFSPYPDHVVAYDENAVYSSGVIYDDTTIDEWLEQSDYSHYIDRNL